MTEVLFYHLERRPLEAVLPVLLEKCLERGWHSVVQAGSVDRCRALDSHLWTYRDESFLPHGVAGDTPPDGQPVWLTTETDNPIGAQVRFLVDRSTPPDLAEYTRAVFIFDGQDPDAVTEARGHWKALKDGGDNELTYWQQSERGAWERKA